MLTRRHIRVKVMQCIYALTQAGDDSLQKQEKFLKFSIEGMYSLYLSQLAFLLELQQVAKRHAQQSSKKYLASKEDQFPNKDKFVDNAVLMLLAANGQLKEALSKRRINWDFYDEYVNIVYKQMVDSQFYEKYMMLETSDFERDKEFILQLYKELIAPNDKIYDFFEDEKLTWVDDFPIVNTYLVKRLQKLDKKPGGNYFTPRLLKDEQDMEFARQLLVKTLLKNVEWEAEIEGKTPNWDKDRIAEIDHILLKMAICELLNFPSIPERVTLNEYLEIAKEYSTPKSSIFINGILDKLVREYKESGKMKKMGRGLL